MCGEGISLVMRTHINRNCCAFWVMAPSEMPSPVIGYRRQ